MESTMSTLDFLRNYKPNNSKQTSSLITIISPKISVQQLRDLVKGEQTTAINIKNNTNRKSVQAALSNIWTVVSSLKEIPREGIAIYSGQYI